jgi:hypothetical protein
MLIKIIIFAYYKINVISDVYFLTGKVTQRKFFSLSLLLFF